MSESNDEAIGCEGLSKRYFDGDQKILAIKDVTLSVPRGRLWVLQGASGSGKTTLLGLLGAMIAPTQGEVRIGGTNVTHMREHHRTAWRREHVGFVFQDLALIGAMTLLENVLLPLVPSGGAGPDDVSRAKKLLNDFGLGDRVQSKAARLSGGQRQRGALARALINKPELLLLDEPTAHVDAASAELILELLASQRDKGTTVLVSTHDPRVAQDDRVDRIVAIEQGELLS